MSPLRVRILGIAVVGVAVIGMPSFSSAAVRSTAGGRLIAPGRTSPTAVPDEAGGVIVASRDPTTATAVVNRYSDVGLPLWDQGLSFDGAFGIDLASDGAGGAIVSVPEPASGTTLVGRILHGGASTWSYSLPSGIVASGGDGGVWLISQKGELFAEGVTSDGYLRSRVQVSFSPDSEAMPAAIGDGNGGAYLAWRATTAVGQYALRLQHVTPEGALWTQPAEVAGSSDPNLEAHLSLDGRGGVLVSWFSAGRLWVHDYGADGLPAWEQVHTTADARPEIHLTAAATDGAYVVWARRLREEPRALDLLSVTWVSNGDDRWTRHIATVDGGVLDVRAATQRSAIVVGWQSAVLGKIGAVIDSDLSVARVVESGSSVIAGKNQALANSFGPDSFGSIVDAGNGTAIAVFTQSPCLRADVSGVALQRIGATGERTFTPDGACP